MQNIKIKNALDLCVIDIEGTIGVAEEWQFESVDERVSTYEKFRESVAMIEAVEAARVVVNIRSTGGDVNDAMLIYEALTSLGIPITTRCYGYVASAATVIAQAGSQGERLISTNALYLVHNSTCVAEGNAQDLAARLDLLQKTDERLSELYARRSSKTAEEFIALMSEEGGNGRWLNAEEVIALGLADKSFDASVEKSEDGGLWRKIGKKLGMEQPETSPEKLPEDNHNVLHEESAMSQDRQKQRLFETRQREVKATTLMQVEDPSLGEVVATRNQQAYMNDAKSFKA